MKYEIIGGSFPACTVTLNANEKVFTQSGAMSWCDSDIKMSTNMKGGFFKSFGRAFSGTSLMFVEHEALRDNSHITFSSSFPGSIKEFNVDDTHEYIAQKSAFLVGDMGVNVSATVNKNFWAGVFGGEGLIMQRFTGNGTIIASIDGTAKEVELKENETIRVETGHVAVFESTVKYNIESVKGFSNVLFSGQGFFFTTLTGPGKVWLQTLTAKDLAKKLNPYITRVHTSSSSSNNPSSNSSSSSK